MLIYELIANRFQTALGGDFLLDYNTNIDENWYDNLKEDELTHCVLRLDSGETQYIGDLTLKVETMHISFAVPNVPKESWKKAVEKIEEVRATLNNTLVQTGENAFCKILMLQRTDGQLDRINGVDWILTDLYFQVQEFHSLYTSDDREIQIGGVKLIGIIHSIYDYNKSLDSYVKGSNVGATNRVNSAQRTLTIDLVPSDDNSTLKTIHENEETNTTYSVTYKNGYTTRTFNALMVHLTEDVITGDIIKNQITFVESK